MKNTSLLPPSGRDLEVYRRLHVEGCSTREVALSMQVSQTRVCQIAEKVGQYLTTVAPAKDDQQRDKQLAVAEQVAALRVDFLYGAALQSWRKSQGTQTTTRKLASAMKAPVTVKTTRNSPGDSRYLLLAARLAMMAAKLPAACLELLVGEGEEEADDESAVAAPSPNGDCSAQNAAASDSHEMPDKTAVNSVNWPTNRDCSPDAITPAVKAPPLNRKERRARNKLLQQKLGKG